MGREREREGGREGSYRIGRGMLSGVCRRWSTGRDMSYWMPCSREWE